MSKEEKHRITDNKSGMTFEFTQNKDGTMKAEIVQDPSTMIVVDVSGRKIEEIYNAATIFGTSFNPPPQAATAVDISKLTDPSSEYLLIKKASVKVLVEDGEQVRPGHYEKRFSIQVEADCYSEVSKAMSAFWGDLEAVMKSRIPDRAKGGKP